MWYVICVCVFCVTTMFIICTSTKDMMTPITNIYKRFKATRSMQTSLRCVSTIAQQTLSKHIPQLSKNLQLPISILKSRNSFNQHLTQILLEHSDIHIYIYISIWPWINWINIYTYHLHPLISYFYVHQGYKVLTHPLTSFDFHGIPWGTHQRQLNKFWTYGKSGKKT